MITITKQSRRYEITDLPTKCLTKILSFLGKEDLLTLTKAIQNINSKKFKAPIWRLIGLECFQLRFKEPDYTDEDINDAEFIEHRLFRNLENGNKHRDESQQEEGWRGCLRLYKKLKEFWLEFSQNVEIQFSHCMVDRIMEILKDPELPVLKLRKTNQCERANTNFQNFLLDRLKDPGDGDSEESEFTSGGNLGLNNLGDFRYQNDDDALLDYLSQEVEQIISIGFTEEEEEILSRRYYNRLDPEEYLMDIPESSQNVSNIKTFGKWDNLSSNISLERTESDYAELPQLGMYRNVSVGNVIDGVHDTPKLTSNYSFQKNTPEKFNIEKKLFVHSGTSGRIGNYDYGKSNTTSFREPDRMSLNKSDSKRISEKDNEEEGGGCMQEENTVEDNQPRRHTFDMREDFMEAENLGLNRSPSLRMPGPGLSLKGGNNMSGKYSMEEIEDLSLSNSRLPPPMAPMGNLAPPIDEFDDLPPPLGSLSMKGMATSNFGSGSHTNFSLPMEALSHLGTLVDHKKLHLLQYLATIEIACLLYCRIAVLFIKGQENMSSRLTAYTHFWNKFVKGVMQMDEEFAHSAESLDNVCFNLFSNYPLYPKFSIWRLMVKIWHEEVYLSTKNNLTKTFLRLLLNHRVNYLLNMEDENEISLIDTMPANFFRLSKLKNSSIYEDFKKFFKKNSVDQEKVSQVLQNYVYSIADLSLNECSIHYITHTKVKMGKPYIRLENAILKQTKKIYKNLHPYRQGKQLFRNFFSMDCKTISTLCLNRTYSIYFSYVCSIAVKTLDSEIKLIRKNHMGSSQDEDRNVLIRSGSEDNLEDPKSGFYLSEFFPIDNQDYPDFSSEEDEIKDLQKTNSCKSRIREKEQRKSSTRASFGADREEEDLDGETREKIEQKVKPCAILKNQIVREIRLNCEQIELSNACELKFESKDKSTDEFNEKRQIPRDLDQAEIFYELSSEVTVDFVRSLVKMNDESENVVMSHDSSYTDDEGHTDVETCIESDLFMEREEFAIPWVETMNFPDEEPRLVSSN